MRLAALLTDVGVRLKMAGLPADAVKHYLEALEVCPSYAQAMYNMAVAYADISQPKKAHFYYEQCLKHNASHVEAWCNLGVLHRKGGNADLAMQSYEKALSCNPNHDLAKANLAVALCEKATAIKQLEPCIAKRLYKRALAFQPSSADAHYNLGVLYAETGKLERALLSYNLAIRFDPHLTEAHNNLGVVHKDLGNLQKALECYKNALQCDRQHHQTHNNIAVVYTLLGDVDSATEHLRKANIISPAFAEAYNNIGVLLRDQGDIDLAITYYERCSQIDSRADMAAQNRLHALSYSEKWTKAQVYEQHVKWGTAFQRRIDNEIVQAAKGEQSENPVAAHLLKCLESPPRPDPERPRGPNTKSPLRIGYVSPDFFTHSVSYFAQVLLEEYDKEGFEVYAYANVAQPDWKTSLFRRLVGEKRWRNIWSLTASDAAKLIIQDKIDILVELAGHTANNRLDIMALRLAPIHVTWIGYPNTTGLRTIHYRVTDGTVDPIDTSQQFSEKLFRLPDMFLCYMPAPDAPDVASKPPLECSGGIVTFGSFNVLSKIQTGTIQLWASILKRVPNSRLLLKAKPFASPTAKKRMEELFEKEGMSKDRLDLVPLISTTRSHLEMYGHLDIGLDPFPYAGTTTTCEALYMGVPVITKGTKAENGDHAHNVGASLLRTIGHSELIAYTDEEYIEKAVKLSGDLDALKKMRSSLRGDMMESALGEMDKFMYNVEKMFCCMWREQGGVTMEEDNETGWNGERVQASSSATNGIGKESEVKCDSACRVWSGDSDKRGAKGGEIGGEKSVAINEKVGRKGCKGECGDDAKEEVS